VNARRSTEGKTGGSVSSAGSGSFARSHLPGRAMGYSHGDGRVDLPYTRRTAGADCLMATNGEVYFNAFTGIGAGII